MTKIKRNSKLKASAEFSQCETYRYVLTRQLKTVLRWYKPAVFVMLNPSTADEMKNDPTVKRCIDFAEREGCTHLTVLNLFALRSTDPKALAKHEDPIGPLNDAKIEQIINEHRNLGLIVAAWGSHPFAQARGKDLIKRFGPFECLGTTKNGSPRHPLYVKKDAPIVWLR